MNAHWLPPTAAALLLPALSALAAGSTDPGPHTLVVSATRIPVDLKSAPASVDLITAEDLEHMALFTVDEALRRSAGVMDRRTKGFMETTPALTIRGFANARDNLVLVDGVPQNDSRNGQVNWTMIDSESIERVELVRGPFSSLYGGNAMGGVVSIITRPPERSGIRLKLGLGGPLGGSTAAEDFRDVAASGTLKISDALAVGASFRRRRTDGYPTTHVNVATVPAGTTGAIPYTSNTGASTNLIGDTGDNWYHDDTIGLKLSYAPSADTRLDLSWANSDADYGYDFPHTLLKTGGVETFGGVALSSWLNGAVFARGGAIEQTNTGLNFRTRWNELSMQLTAGYIDKSTQTVIVGGITPANSGHAAMNPVSFTGGDGRLAPVNDTTRATLDLQFDLPLGDAHLLSFGVAGSRGDIHEERWSLLNWNDPSSKVFMGSKTVARDRMHSAYVQDAWDIDEAWTLYAGARLDRWEMRGGRSTSYVQAGGSGTLHYGDVDSTTLNPKLSVVHRPSAATAYRASVGKAFRPPNLFEFFGTAQIGGDSYAGNPELKPESVVSWEAGVDHDFPIGINLAATAFRSRIRDSIGTVTTAGIATPRNTGKAQVRGMELKASGPLPWGFAWNANYTLTHSEVTSNDTNPALVGKRLAHVPKTMYNIGLDWQQGDWRVSTNHYHQSKRFTNAANTDIHTRAPGTTDPFSLTDVEASWQISGQYRVSLAVNNLFDREYHQFYLSPGRFWFLQLRAAY